MKFSRKSAVVLALVGAAYIGLPYTLVQYLGLGTLRAGHLDRSQLALTFDDGPHPIYTPRILDALAAAQMQATFFVLLKPAQRHPAILRRILAEGHQIGVHAAQHQHAWSQWPHLAYTDFLRARKGLEALIGQPIHLARPPHGAYTAANLLGLRRAGLTPVHWSLEGGDWQKGMTPQRLRQRLRQRWQGGPRPSATKVTSPYEFRKLPRSFSGSDTMDFLSFLLNLCSSCTDHC